MNEELLTGFKTYRYESNPCEKAIAEYWKNYVLDQYKFSPGSCFLERICSRVSSDDKRVVEYLSDKEIKIVSTFVQWLGSPIGKRFVEDIYKIVNIDN